MLYIDDIPEYVKAAPEYEEVVALEKVLFEIEENHAVKDATIKAGIICAGGVCLMLFLQWQVLC